MLVNNAVAPDVPPPLVELLNRARNQHLSLSELLQLVESLSETGQARLASELYRTWIAFNDTHPLLHVVYFNYSVNLRQLGDVAGAIHALRACLKIDPRFGQAHINLGRALEDCGSTGQAVQQWYSYLDATNEITAERAGHRLMMLQHVGRVLENAGHFEKAETALWQAIELRPDKTESAQHWTSLRQRQCKWPTLVGSDHVSTRQLLDAMSPLTLACHVDDPLFQLAKAYRYNKQLVGQPDLKNFPRKQPRMKTGTEQRLRVGYVSSDLRDHAVGFALSEVLELHDKRSVEVFAYYCGEPRTNDATQERIKIAIDSWRDITGLSDIDAAAQIGADEIDILIDVNGYTKHARTGIFAFRPAPVIVNFCGYPGSMGSPYHQYIIADDQIIPPENEIYFTEKVLRIACDQPVDRKRLIGSRPSRPEAGLPENNFIFACFNGMQKITAACFARWMTILSAVPDSVLWLLGGDDDVNQRLALLSARLGRLVHTIPESAAHERQQLEQAREDVGELLRELQTLSHRLHPPRLEYLGLVEASAAMCREISRQHDLEVSFHGETVPPHLSKRVALCLYRVLQEALQNAIKHSGTARIDVMVRGGSDHVELTIEDFGVGLDVKAAEGTGLGLASMKERLKAVKGQLHIRSQPRRGTSIEVRVPVLHR